MGLSSPSLARQWESLSTKAALVILATALSGCERHPASPPLASCDAPYIERDERKCADYREWTDTSVSPIASGGCRVCAELLHRVPPKPGPSS